MCIIGEIARFQPKNANIQMATKSTALKITIWNIFLANSPVIAQSKDFREGKVGKYGQN